MNIKFSCRDMADQKTELYAICKKIRMLSDRVAGCANAHGMGAAMSGDLPAQMRACQNSMDALADRMAASAEMLGHIIDIYCAAEGLALDASFELRNGAGAVGSAVHSILPINARPRCANASGGFPPPVSVAAIMRKDLIVENWLAEIIYRQRA